FLRRVWNFARESERFIQKARRDAAAIERLLAKEGFPPSLERARREVHLSLKQANQDFERLQFNTVASAAMKILNALERAPGPDVPEQDKGYSGYADAYARLIEEGLSILLRLLAPITPHIAHVLWRELGYGEDVSSASWPEHDEAALAQESIENVVQV